MARLRRSKRLARELAFDPARELEKKHLNPYVLSHLCDLADEKMISGERDCLRVARLCCRIAGRLRTDEGITLSFARLASALRVACRLDHAKRALEVAFANAPDDLKGDLYRRRCWRRLYQRRLADALRDAEVAVDLTSGAERARALGALGTVHGYRGKSRQAIRAHEQCLAETNPDAEHAYCVAIHNYATSLAKGTVKEARKALALCAEARSRLKRRHKMQRAKLWWTEGLLHLRLDEPQKAWLALDVARRSLIALQAAPEVAAIVADMARADPQPLAVRHICDEAAAVIVASHPLTEPLGDLALASREAIPEASSVLREAASRLAVCPAL